MQTLFTPHTAFLTNEALSNIVDTTVSNIGDWLEDKPLVNEVKPMKA